MKIFCKRCKSLMVFSKCRKKNLLSDDMKKKYKITHCYNKCIIIHSYNNSYICFIIHYCNYEKFANKVHIKRKLIITIIRLIQYIKHDITSSYHSLLLFTTILYKFHHHIQHTIKYGIIFE